MTRYFLLALLVIFAFSAPRHSNAQNSCPWINDATVAGVLEANVQTSVQEMPVKGMICAFKTAEQTGTRSLVVEIRAVGDREKSLAAAESRCTSAATAVIGLGNEAFECVADQAGSHGMIMIGRVRDTLFVVTVMMPVHRDQKTNDASLEEKLTIATGQVVGNLF